MRSGPLSACTLPPFSSKPWRGSLGFSPGTLNDSKGVSSGITALGRTKAPMLVSWTNGVDGLTGRAPRITFLRTAINPCDQRDDLAEGQALSSDERKVSRYGYRWCPSALRSDHFVGLCGAEVRTRSDVAKRMHRSQPSTSRLALSWADKAGR